MRRPVVVGVLLLALASGACKKSTPESAPATQPPAQAPPATQKGLREVIVGTWSVRDIGKGRRQFTATYGADGVTETRAADGRSEKENYRVLDDRTVEYAGPPAVKGAVERVSDDELRVSFPDGVAIELKRQKS